MKKIIILLFFFALFLSAYSQGRPSYVPSNGLVGWWPFTGNAIDSSGTGNNGSVTGAVLTSDRFGRSNQAYSFDGNADYINCGNASSLNISGSITISAWIYANNFNTDHGIVSKWNTSPSYDLVTNSPFSIAPLNKLRWLEAGGFLFSNAINASTWYHVVTVFDVANQKKYIYINGDLAVQSSVSLSAIPTNSNNLYIGAHQPSNVSFWSWDGKLDDVGIWNRALTECEIKSLYNSKAHTIPILNIGNDTIRSCKLDSLKLTANNGFASYNWSNGANTKNTYIKTTGKIVVIATDSLGCKAKDSVMISVLNPRIAPRDTIVCKGSQVTLRSKVNSTISNTTCGYMPNTLKSGLVGWFPFCGNANDESGNAYNGVANNGASLTSDHNNINTAAYSFDGVDDVINTSLPYTKLLRSKGFSVSAWIKLGSSTTFYSYSIVNNMNPSATQFWMGLEGTQNNGANHRKPTLFFNSFNGGSQAVTVPNFTVQTNTWTHLTFTLKNNTIWFYANGVLTYTKSVNFDSLSTEAPAPNVKIGRGNLTPGFYQDFNGSIDDVGIWNRALSESEVQRLYSSTDPIKLTWSTSDTTQTTKVTVNANTKVWLKATDGIGVCYDTASIILSQPVLPLNDTTLFTACNRDSMLLNIGSKWNNVLWSNGDKDSTTYLANTGKYYLQAKDQYGCLATDSTYFVNPGKPKIQKLVADSVNCFGAKDGSLTSAYSGGFKPYTFKWNDAAKQSTPNALGLPKGQYQLVLSDFYNCKDSLSADVNEPLKLRVNLVSTDSVNCFGGNDGSVKVSVSGGSNGYAYLWNDPLKQETATATGLSKGTYKVNVKDIYGCSDSLSADVLEPIKVKVDIQSFANAKCFGYTDGSALANGSGGTGQLKYTWNTSPVQTSNAATNLGKGVYQVMAVDVYGCFDTTSVSISEPLKIIPVVSGNRLAVRDVMHELSATVTPAQTYTYSWTPSSVFGNNTNTSIKNAKFYTSTLVTLRTTDASGCFGEDTATITVLIPFADFIPTVFSPNTDKHNDVFGLPDIFEIEQLDVYDRWGALLFKGSKDQPVWDGTYGGQSVPVGTYMYIIKAKLKETVYSFEHKGVISVIK